MIIEDSMVSLAKRYTKLEFHEKTKRYYGTCPFCHSGADMFCADNKNGVFWCYACGKHGNMDDFKILMGQEKPEMPQEPDDEELQTIYEAAAIFYFRYLMEHRDSDAFRYITKTRKLPESTLSAFGLGYAPVENAMLYQYLSKRFSEQQIYASGLVKHGKDGQPYDMFRNRIMFPILNRKGRTVAFGGRRLGDGYGPKYLNSAENRIFSKHTILYGFQTAIAAAEEEKSIVIGEGYMDLIAMQTHGIRNSAAVLGTALTEEHANMIRNFYSHVCLSLDSDGPGIRAAARSIPILQNAGLQVSILHTSPAKDPDEFLQTYGEEEFRKRIENGLDPERFLVRAADDPEEEFIRQMIKKM